MFPNYAPKLCSQTLFQTMLPNYVPKQCSQTVFANNVPTSQAGPPTQPALEKAFDDLNNPNNFEGPVRMRNPVAHTEPKPNYPKTKLTKHIPQTTPKCRLCKRPPRQTTTQTSKKHFSLTTPKSTIILQARNAVGTGTHYIMDGRSRCSPSPLCLPFGGPFLAPRGPVETEFASL